MSINYDDPAMQVTKSAFVNWDNLGVGGSVEGTITAAVQGTDFNGAPCPQYDLESNDGETVTLTCGQADLKDQTMKLRPQVGDRLKVTFSRVRPTASGFKKKFFDVEHTKAGVAAANARLGSMAGGAPAVDDSEPPF